eukprot:546617-Pelagomonas_calceolata.AAC.1
MLPQDLVDVALQRLRALVATRLVGVVRARVGHNLLEVRDKGTPGGVGPGVQLLLHHREAHGCLDDGVVVGRAALVHGVDEVALFVCGHHLLQDAVQEEEGVLSVLVAPFSLPCHPPLSPLLVSLHRLRVCLSCLHCLHCCCRGAGFRLLLPSHRGKGGQAAQHQRGWAA